jgi:hypothetical protein
MFLFGKKKVELRTWLKVKEKGFERDYIIAYYLLAP